MLDTLSQVEIWRRWLNLDPFPETWYQRCCAATDSLQSMVDVFSGDGPNLPTMALSVISLAASPTGISVLPCN